MNQTTGACEIPGVSLRPLKIITTDGGPVLHMLRTDSPEFAGFGEVYFSEVEPGCVKGWKQHTRQTQFFAVPSGQLRIVLHYQGTFMDLQLGRPDNYALLRIPPLVWYAFAAVGDRPALLCNCADLPHDPTEGRKQPLETIPYF